MFGQCKAAGGPHLLQAAGVGGHGLGSLLRRDFTGHCGLDKLQRRGLGCRCGRAWGWDGAGTGVRHGRGCNRAGRRAPGASVDGVRSRAARQLGPGKSRHRGRKASEEDGCCLLDVSVERASDRPRDAQYKQA